MIKRLITPLVFILLFLAAAIATFAVLNHRNQYVQIQTKAETQERAKLDESTKQRIADLEAQNRAAELRANSLYNECQKGVVAYTNLTAFLKRNLDAPNCEVK